MSLKKYLLAGGLSTILILGACGNGDEEESSEEETTEETEDTESEDTGEEDVDAAEEDAEDSDSEEDTDEDSESEDDAADSDEDSEDESSVDLDSDDEDSSSSLGAIDDADTDEADEDATDGEEESKTFVLEENGTYNELVYYFVGDEVTRQTSVTEMDYAAIGAANEEEARELMDEFAEEYTDTDGVEHNIDYGEDGFVETTEVNYDEADFTEVSDLEGAEFEGEETSDFVSMERSEQQLLNSGYELTEGEPASGSDSDPDSGGSASTIDFSSITDETLSGDETEISSMFELNSGIAERLDEAEESEIDIEEVLKPSDEITSYYSETYMVIHAFAGGSDTPAESDVAGLNAEIDESDGFEVYSEVFDTAAGEFVPNIYANADQLASHDGAGWVDQTGIAESEEVYYGNYSNLYDAFMETSDVIDISEDDDYYFLHNIGTEASLDEVFGSLFNVEYTGANTDEMVNAIVGIVDKSTGEFAHVAYISTAPGQENPEEQLHIEISAQFNQYGEFDDAGVTVPDVPENGSAGAAGDEDTDGSDSSSEESSGTAEDGLAVGDSAELEGVTMTVDDASYTDERNEFAEVDADEVLMLELSIENNTGENYMPSSLDMEVLIDGSPAETYPVGDVILDETADGDSSTGTLAYAVTGDPSEIEFVFSPSSTEDSAIFDITPE